MVKRYDFYDRNDDEARAHAAYYGQYVTYTDYAKLQAKADALEAVMRFYADENNDKPNDGPWGVYSDDFGYRARIALAQHGSKS